MPGSRARRNNNPGNIEYGPFTVKHGAIGTDGRFAKFLTPEAGFLALKSLLLTKYPDRSIELMLRAYAPSNENDTETYVARVCEWTGHQPDDLVKDCLD